MSNLLNYLPCPKCLNCSSNIIQIDNKRNEIEDDIFLKLSCVQKCSINYVKFQDLKQILNNQIKVPISIFIYGKFSEEQNQIENNSTKIFNIINKIYSNIESIEKEIIKIKEEIKKEITIYKNNFINFKLLHELIYGAYLKNVRDNIPQDNNINLNKNLELININKESNYNIQNNFYIKEIEKDICKINTSIDYIKNEVILYLKNNKVISINEIMNKNNIIDFNHINCCRNQNHNKVDTFNTSLKNIESILQLSDGNIILGSTEQMIIYNLELKKEIMYIPGDFSDIRELKYNKIYQSNKNIKNIIILSVQNKSIKIYDLYNKSLLLNYSQFYNIDNILELYNGDILYVCDFNIHNINLREEFNIPLKYFCFSLINLYDKQNILGYTNLSKINFVYLDKPRKIIKEIEIKESKEIFDLKQIYDEKININYLIILSSNFLDIYDLNMNQFKFRNILNKVKFFKKIYFSFYKEVINYYIVGENSVQLFNIKKDHFIHVHTIDSLKTKSTRLYSKIITTPFNISRSGKYLLIFDSNEEGFNSI